MAPYRWNSAMAAVKAKSSRPDSRQRTVGKVTAVLLTAALIVGTGLFNSLGAATAEAGSGILVAMLIRADRTPYRYQRGASRRQLPGRRRRVHLAPPLRLSCTELRCRLLVPFQGDSGGG